MTSATRDRPGRAGSSGAAEAQRVAVIGYPLRHSISPAFQQPAFDFLGLAVRYLARETRPDELGAFLAEFRHPPWLGLNVTVPHKEPVASATDRLSEEARLIGAVNTVQKDGRRVVGHNTDAVGFLRAMQDDTAYDPAGHAAVILGAGGAARAAAVALLRAGVRHLSIANRTISRAQGLADALGNHFGSERVTAAPLDSDALAVALRGASLLVNTTTVGMAHGPAADTAPLDPVLLDLLRPDGLAYDLVYNPTTTRLLHEAAARGLATLGGLPMLIYQGAASFELWTGQTAPVELMLEHGRRAMAERGRET